MKKREIGRLGHIIEKEVQCRKGERNNPPKNTTLHKRTFDQLSCDVAYLEIYCSLRLKSYCVKGKSLTRMVTN